MWQLFWLACGAFSTFTFGKAMKELNKENKAARKWLADLGPQDRWTKHKFDTQLKCDVNKTNFVESFNATLGTDRCKPVLTLLEGIRRVTMVRLATRRQKCATWEKLCPNIVKRVQQLCNDSRSCRAFMSNVGEYEVMEGKSSLAVSLNNHTCLCNVWQLTGIPCKHAMRAILHEGLDPHSFVHECYSVDNYKLAYVESIKPIPDQDKWPASNSPSILPPIIKRGV
jgi:SWIM zinc finger